VLLAIRQAIASGIAKAILVGDEPSIKAFLEKVDMPPGVEIVHEESIECAALKAVELVSSGRADIVMKGLVNSSDFLKAVLNADVGLRTGRLLSHLAAYEIPGSDRLVFHTDGGMNIAPSLSEKKQILINALLAMHAMGITKPNVAILTANEQVNPKMPATVDAKDLMDLCLAGQLPAATVEGPIAMDVIISPEAAKHKGIKSQISGNVDLILHPNIETGNAVGKSMIYYGKAKMAGLVLGATHPIVMTSRAETPEGKLNSIAMACLISQGNFGKRN